MSGKQNQRAVPRKCIVSEDPSIRPSVDEAGASCILKAEAEMIVTACMEVLQKGNNVQLKLRKDGTLAVMEVKMNTAFQFNK